MQRAVVVVGGDQNQVPDCQRVPDPQLQVPWFKMETYLNALSLLLRSPCVRENLPSYWHLMFLWRGGQVWVMAG